MIEDFSFLECTNQLKVTWRFGGTYHIYIQGWKVTHARNQTKPGIVYIGVLLGLVFNPEDADDVFLRNNDWSSTNYMSLYPRR
jgi:hypothetical protein